MQVFDTRRAVKQQVRDWRARGERVALVPTMGNLHSGHLSLIQKASALADRVIASIYVNPTQFGEGEDFDRYPRTLQEDLVQLEHENCDLVFNPADKEIYPYGLAQSCRLSASPELAGRLEGASRPDHFDGVVTVVARLFAIVTPDVAVFGEKDYQQLLVIRRMNEDLGFGIEVVGAPTVRNNNGLALSSRNAFLGSQGEQTAGVLNHVLRSTSQRAAGNEDFAGLEQEASDTLERTGLKVDYVAIRRADDLSVPTVNDSDLRILAAVRCGETRLIDNMAVPSG